MSRPKKKRLGRPPLPKGQRHERVNMTLPQDVIAKLALIGNGNRSGAVVQLTRERMSRDGELPPLAAFPGYEA